MEVLLSFRVFQCRRELERNGTPLLESASMTERNIMIRHAAVEKCTKYGRVLHISTQAHP
jgi:hypothetical protein